MARSGVMYRLNILDLDGTAQQTSSAGSDETNLLSRNSGAGNSRSLSDVLMVTTTMRMINRVHSNTTSAGPVVTLGLELVECTTGLEEGLVDPSTTGNDANGSTGTARDGLLGTRRKTNAGLVVIGRVSNDGGVVAGSAGKSTTVADLLLNVADDGTFRALAHGEDVSDGESSLLSAIDEGTGVKALSGNESLLAELVAVGIPENNTGEGGTTTSIVDDLLHNSADVTVTLSKIEVTETGGILVVVGVGGEDGVRAPLSPDNPTHGLS